jgi:hypothetical protein
VKSTFTFEEMIELLRTFTPRDEIILEEVPAPQKLAATHLPLLQIFPMAKKVMQKMK